MSKAEKKSDAPAKSEAPAKNDAPAKNKAPRKKILIVDDHPIVLHGMAELISQEPSLEVCGLAANEEAALKLLKEHAVDLVILDFSIEDAGGVPFIRQVRTLYPKLHILVLSMYEDALHTEVSLRAGANGYVIKSEAADTILKAIQMVLGGEVYVSETVGRQMLKGFLSTMSEGGPRTGIESLTDRELEIFDMIGKGMTTREIAFKLNLSHKTVETHRSRIKNKMHIKNSAELAMHASNWVNNDWQ